MPAQQSIALKSMKPTLWQAILGSLLLLLLPLIYFSNFNTLKQKSLEEADHHLGLYEHSLGSELEKSQNLAFFLSRDAAVRDGLLSPGDVSTASAKLVAISDRVPGALTFVFDTQSTFIAGSGDFPRDGKSGFIAAEAGAYLNMLLDGDGYTFYSTDPITSEPCYVSLAPVLDNDGNILGFVAAVLPLLNLEAFWKSAGHQIFATNAEGRVVLSSDQSWRGKTLSSSSTTDQHIAFQPDNAHNVQFFGSDSFFVSQQVAGIEWTLYYILPKGPIYSEALGNLFYAAIGVILVMCGLYVYNVNMVRHQLR